MSALPPEADRGRLQKIRARNLNTATNVAEMPQRQKSDELRLT
jgi:hypothetical protein